LTEEELKRVAGGITQKGNEPSHADDAAAAAAWNRRARILRYQAVVKADAISRSNCGETRRQAIFSYASIMLRCMSLFLMWWTVPAPGNEVP